MKDNSTLNYLKVKLAALQGLASGGDKAAAKELTRRGVPPVSPHDVTKLDYLALRTMVLRWRDGATTVEQADSFHRAQRAQDELSIRWRTRSRIGWSKLDAHLFGPEGLASLPVAPWMVPRPPRCVAWKRPMSSTLYPSDADIQRSQLNSYARSFYAAGAPQPKE